MIHGMGVIQSGAKDLLLAYCLTKKQIPRFALDDTSLKRVIPRNLLLPFVDEVQQQIPRFALDDTDLQIARSALDDTARCPALQPLTCAHRIG